MEYDNLQSYGSIIKNNIESLQKKIDEGKSSIKARLNEDLDKKFDASFTIPDTVEFDKEYSLQDMKKKCKENNIELAQASERIKEENSLIEKLKAIAGEDDVEYRKAVAEVEKLKNDKLIQERNIDLYVERQYNSFTSALKNYDAMLERKQVHDKKLTELNDKFHIGLLSHVDYLSDKYDILKERISLYNSIVGKINAISAMELVDAGIVIEDM